MKRSYIAFVILFAVAWFTSCKDNDLFEKEMYKNLVAMISSEYYNTFKEEVPLTGGEFIGYIAASAGGSHATNTDLVVEFAEDSSPLDFYNFSLFDADSSLYARLLPKDKYEIPSYKITIPAGERTGKTMIRIRPEGLSPDSIYFVALKVNDKSTAEINEKKNTVLYQVILKNNYASQANNDSYAMSGFINQLVTAGNKKMFPLSRNKVRIIAGKETFEPKIDKINKSSIILEIKEDNRVLISSYKDISVTQIDGDPKYPNVFKREESFGRIYNTFLLSYDYVIGSTTHHMQEELRMELK